MATYGVTPADVAAELPSLFPDGFGVGTLPPTVQVMTFIETADALVSLKVQDVTGVAPQVADRAALLAKEYVIARAVARVMKVVYAGRESGGVDPATSYFISAAELLKGIEALGAQAAGTGDVAPNLAVSMPVNRELLICDAELDGGTNRYRRY